MSGEIIIERGILRLGGSVFMLRSSWQKFFHSAPVAASSSPGAAVPRLPAAPGSCSGHPEPLAVIPTLGVIQLMFE